MAYNRRESKNQPKFVLSNLIGDGLYMIYVCENCHFTFERVGNVEHCPDCGKINIRHAKEEETKKYLQIKEDSLKANLNFRLRTINILKL